MTVTETIGVANDGHGGTVWVHLAGTISEVLTALANAGINAPRAAITSDDGSNMTAIYCKQE